MKLQRRKFRIEYSDPSREEFLEYYSEVQNFVDCIGRVDIQNVCEYKTGSSRVDRAGYINIVVFYWA